jgi:hypothetical protein
MVLETPKQTQSLSTKPSTDNLRDTAGKQTQGKGGMKIFRKKDRPSPGVPSREPSSDSVSKLVNGKSSICVKY